MGSRNGFKSASKGKDRDESGRVQVQQQQQHPASALGAPGHGRLRQEGNEAGVFLVVRSSPTSLYLQTFSAGPWLESLRIRLAAHTAATSPLGSIFCARPQVRILKERIFF